MKTLNELFRELILANELSNNIKAALRFSDPDGVLSGKSGWSFGVCQYDIQNNDNAILCLKECGFTDSEITELKNQTVKNMTFMNAQLAQHPDVIAKWDELQLSHCLQKALDFVTVHGIPVESPGGILAGADYVNQYGSQGNGAKLYYRALGRPVTAKDVLNFKLTNTKYGREHPKDCQRRYDNLIKILNEVTV